MLEQQGTAVVTASPCGSFREANPTFTGLSNGSSAQLTLVLGPRRAHVPSRYQGRGEHSGVIATAPITVLAHSTARCQDRQRVRWSPRKHNSQEGRKVFDPVLSSGTCPPDPERRHTALSSGRKVYKPWGVKDAPVSSACDHTGRHQILEERKTGQTTYEKTNICDDPQVWFQIKSPDRWDSLNRKRLFRGTRISGLEKAS